MDSKFYLHIPAEIMKKVLVHWLYINMDNIKGAESKNCWD